MSEICPESGCGYESSEHGVKVHYGRSEDHEGTIADHYFECVVCGEETYDDYSKNKRKCCSNLCGGIHRSGYDSVSDYYYDKVDICENCGDVIEHSPSESYKFCSRKCSDKGRNDPGKERVVVECNECGSKLKRRPNRIERSNNHYCSIKCRGAGWQNSMVEVPDLDLKVRSNWEREFVLGLDKRSISFEYEKTFNLEDRVYSPDFLVGDVVVEIKGWGRKDDVERAKEFMQEKSNYEYVVLQGDGEKLPADKWYSWSERKEVYGYLNEMTGV